MRLCALTVWFLGFLIIQAAAHESRPLLVSITERAPQKFEVSWKIPPSALNVTAPYVVMPDSCRALGKPTGTQTLKRQLFDCQDDLSDAKISIAFPGYNPSISTLFQFTRLSGEKHTAIQGPSSPHWKIPQKEATSSVARQYLLLGVSHILFGYDHLLFVACLIFIAGSWRRILITITGFTLAHSVTLILAALNLVRIPVPPVEAVIAISIVFLATEIARNNRDTLTWRYPVAVSVSFGLLHGFGFASVLQEIGLPQTEVPAALLFFNVGVEVGQVMFVIALIAVSALLLRIWRQTGHQEDTSDTALLPQTLARPAAYLIGCVAAFWLFERMAGFLA
ncbi:MAG: HupE/UreJ family protein [Hyphomicrobiales bacterium]